MILSVQFYTLILMIGMGVLLGVYVDTYRLLVRVKLKTKWIKYGYDFLLWMIYGICLFYALYWVNEGTLRIHVFLAVLCGYAMYRALFEVLYIRLMYFLYRLISNLVHFSRKFLKNVVVRPIQWFIMGIYSIFVIILSYIWKQIYIIIRFILHMIIRIVFIFLRILWKFIPKTIQKRIRMIYYKIYQFTYNRWHKIRKFCKRIRFWKNEKEE